MDNRTIPDVLQTIGHEVGHILVDYGHPDEGTGHAPLPKTNHRERLMYSGSGRGARLVKREWDDAEKWLKPNVDGEGNQ